LVQGSTPETALVVDTQFKMANDNPDAANSGDARKALRQSLRKARSSLTASDVDAWSCAIAERANHLVSPAHRLAGYFAVGSEVNVAHLLARCRANTQLTYAPLVKKDNTMSFVPFDENTSLTINRYGIREPAATDKNLLHPEELDAVLVPLLGFDMHCNRIGMGGGYYDRSFAHRRHGEGKPLLVGVAFELQRVENVHADWWDVPLDYIVTEARIIQRVNTPA